MTQSYKSINQKLQCNICDQFKKTLVKSSGSPRLLAITLKDGAAQYKGKSHHSYKKVLLNPTLDSIYAKKVLYKQKSPTFMFNGIFPIDKVFTNC